MKDRFSEISDNIKRIRDEITDTANSCGRDPSGIELIAVTYNRQLSRATHARSSA